MSPELRAERARLLHDDCIRGAELREEHARDLRERAAKLRANARDIEKFAKSRDDDELAQHLGRCALDLECDADAYWRLAQELRHEAEGYKRHQEPREERCGFDALKEERDAHFVGKCRWEL